MARRLRIGVVAPPWVAVPPPAYGGTELVVDTLCVGLERAGHDVTLFTTGDSTCPVRRKWLFEKSDPERMGTSVLELRHVAAAYDALQNVDIVHDHTLSGLFYRSRFPNLPVVATNHGPFNGDLADLFGRVAADVPVIAISHDQASRAPHDLPIARVIHHGLDLERYPFVAHPRDHLIFLGRMSSDKGVDAAIRVAKRSGLPLLIAAKMREPGEIRFFHEFVEPELGDGVEYIGEADFDRKVELLSTAKALLNPIQWPEPFGLVMAEALACGTPVVGYGRGAAPEIVEDGVSGFLAENEDGLVDDLLRVEQIDRVRCRERVADRFSAERMVADHVALYNSVLARSAADESRSVPVHAAVPQGLPNEWVEEDALLLGDSRQLTAGSR